MYKETEKIIIKLFLLGVVLVCLSDISNEMGIVYFAAQFILLILLVTTIILPVDRALILLFMLVLCGQDIVSSGNGLDGYATASVWQMRFGIIRPSWILFICLLAQFPKLKHIEYPKILKYASVWFISVPVVTSLVYGGLGAGHADIEAVSDIRFGLMLILSIVLFLSVMNERASFLKLVLGALVAGILARSLGDLIRFSAGFGPIIHEGISRGSEDSAKGGINLLIFLGLMLAWGRRQWILGVVMTAASVMLLAAYGTRLLWITFLLGVPLIVSLFKFRQQIVFVGSVVGLLVVGLWGLYLTNPSSAEIVLFRSKTITEGNDISNYKIEVDSNLVSRVDPIRYAEMLNILYSANQRNSILWGTGYGGYYSEDFIQFPRFLESAFPEYSFQTGKYYTAHDYSFYVFLKHGLIGFLLITSIWLLPGYRLFHVLRRLDVLMISARSIDNVIIISLLPFLFTALLQLYWSGKGLLINGVIIAIYIYSAQIYRTAAGSSKRISPLLSLADRML